jgi:hypothetical protein
VSHLPPPPGWVPPPPPSYGGPPPWQAGYAPPVHKPGVVALRPLGLGDFFDGAFKTIRRNPRSMIGLSAVVITAFMVVPVALTLALAGLGELRLGSPASGEELDAFESGTVSLVSNLGALFGFLATVLLNGMLVHVVAEAVLGRRTGPGQAWAATRGRMWRLIGLMLLDLLLVLVLVTVPVLAGLLVGLRSGVGAGLAVGGPLLLLALVVLVLVQVRYFQLAAPALVLERGGVWSSLRRAGRLSRGQFWRILGILLLTALVTGLVGQVLAIPLTVVGLGGPLLLPGTAGALVLVFSTYLSQVLVGAVTTPFTSAVVALQYVDQRIRKEGLDVRLIAASQQVPVPR